MKYIIFLSFCISIASCSRSTEEKIKSSIENRWRSHGVESLKIDSLRYELSDLKDYYNYRIEIEKDFRNSQAEILPNVRLAKGYPLIVHIVHDIVLSNDKIRFIENLYDSTKVYNVDYHINYQTSESNYQGHETDYLYANDLSPVYVNVDSLYKSSNINIQFDSVAYVNAFKLNDSLESVIKKLNNELELKIARGTTQMNILNSQSIILKVRQEKAENQLKYPFLF